VSRGADGSMHCTGALAATAVSLAHVLKRCTTEDSVVLCVEVQFECCCVCFNCVSRFFRIVCAMCGDFYSWYMFARRRAMTFRLDLCIIVMKKVRLYAELTVLH